MSERVAVSPCPVEHMVNQACVPTDRKHTKIEESLGPTCLWSGASRNQFCYKIKSLLGGSAGVSDRGKSLGSDRRWSSLVHRGCLGRDIQTPTLHIKPGLV